MLDHPGAAAYCVPGLRSHVVVSSGTLALLSHDELTAVLAHESAHVRERHDLVLLPFGALRRALPWSKVVRDAQAQVELLVEMAADDRARRYCSPTPPGHRPAPLRYGGSRPDPERHARRRPVSGHGEGRQADQAAPRAVALDALRAGRAECDVDHVCPVPVGAALLTSQFAACRC
ncbi:M56 family metallopeptidase [Nonomuraea dietziae]|uniref:M56 family metallopeptidase n=1 Tax=Nonomuraea dietziae TaxID=65515 RepID=UPI0031CF5A4A